MVVGLGNQVLWRSTFFKVLFSFFIIGRISIRSEYCGGMGWTTKPQGTKSGTMICICMAASYLAVYYLKGQHPGAHTDPLLHFMHTYMPAEGRWEALSYRPAIGRCSGAALVPLWNQCQMSGAGWCGWVAWHRPGPMMSAIIPPQYSLTRLVNF
jgi:hypothetical protein